MFDRDGTIIRDPTDLRVDRIDKIELFPDTLSALKRLHDSDFNIILITNQAGISEGRLNANEFNIINAEVIKQLEPSEIEILDVQMCPHTSEDNCVCRKPKPFMLSHSIDKFGLNPSDTFYVGDNVSDVDAAIAAGCKSILVETANSLVSAPHATYAAKNLTGVVDYIVANS